MRRNESPADFYKQNYKTLLNAAKSKKTLFEDKQFLPQQQNFSFADIKQEAIVWRRMTDLSDHPVMFGENPRPIYVKGPVGSSTLINAFLLMPIEARLMVIPWGNEGLSNDYYGIFRFRFWRNFEWIEVVIDDFLPTVGKVKLFSHNAYDLNEFALALTEKALAKLYGGYKNLYWQMNITEILEDLTSGIPDMYRLSQYRHSVKKGIDSHIDQLLDILNVGVCNKNPLGLCVTAQTAKAIDLGILCLPSIYEITSVKYIKVASNSRPQKMVCIRNADETIPLPDVPCDVLEKMIDEERKKEGLLKKHPNDNWIKIEDLVDWFDYVYTCHICDEILLAEKSIWGFWTKQPRRCGALEGEDFLDNPQYYFDVRDSETLVHIQLTRETEHYRECGYGLKLFKVEPNREHRICNSSIFFKKHLLTELNFKYVDKKDNEGNVIRRQVSCRSMYFSNFLTRGRYVLIPATVDGDELDKFVLRIAVQDFKMEINSLSEIKPPHMFFTHIHIFELEELEMKNIPEDAMIRVTCVCESKKYSFRYRRPDKIWTSVIFVRTRPERKPVEISFYAGKDSTNHLGTFTWTNIDELWKANKTLNPSHERPGVLKVMVTQSKNFNKM